MMKPHQEISSQRGLDCGVSRYLAIEKRRPLILQTSLTFLPFGQEDRNVYVRLISTPSGVKYICNVMPSSSNGFSDVNSYISYLRVLTLSFPIWKTSQTAVLAFKLPANVFLNTQFLSKEKHPNLFLELIFFFFHTLLPEVYSTIESAVCFKISTVPLHFST